MKTETKLSVILPVYNERESLAPLVSELKTVLDTAIDGAYEIVLADDGSRDGSHQVLAELAAGDSRIKVVSLRRNFGQTAAIAAGVDHASGEILILMDADGQNDPADIPRMLAQLESGCDIVSGWRRQRRDLLLTRRLPSVCANWIIGRVTGLALHDYGCTLKAYRREFLQGVRLYGDMHRFLPVFGYWLGARVAELEVNHRARSAGVSKYGLARLPRVILDLFVLKLLGDFRTRPIHFFGGVGLLLAVAGSGCGSIVLYQKYMHGIWAHRNPLLLLAVFLFLIGLNLLMLGLLAELIIRTYYESQPKATYCVRATLNLDA
jgi:glycosyltransferase involved in cell wall biosynthesis